MEGRRTHWHAAWPQLGVLVASIALSLASPSMVQGQPCQAHLLGGTTVEVGGGPDSIALADFDNDGLVDVATVSQSSDLFSVLLSNGDGTFRVSAEYPAWSARGIASADFDGDGNEDLSVGRHSADEFLVMLGKGDGTFQLLGATAVGSRPSSMVSADFNGDSEFDLAVAADGVAVFLGNGDGTFMPPSSYSTGSPFHIGVADLDGNGTPDLVTANYYTPDISVLLGVGDGTFLPSVEYPVRQSPRSVAIEDFDNDGALDLAVTNHMSSSYSILRGNGDGTFLPANHYPSLVEPEFVVTQDFDSDGYADLAIVHDYQPTLMILRGNGDATFQPITTYRVGPGPAYLAASDFDGDSVSDLAIASWSWTFMLFMSGNGDGTFQTTRPLSVPEHPADVVTADFDGDSVLDLATANSQSDDVSVLLGGPGGTFQVVGTYRVGDSPISLIAEDLSGDGEIDIAVANRDSSNISVLLGDGTGAFQAPVNHAVGLSPLTVDAGDLNGDTDLDLVVLTASSYDVSVLLGSGGGTFLPAVSYAVGPQATGAAIGEFNGDGALDVAVAQFNQTVTILLGDGNGAFQAPIDVPTADRNTNVAVGDFDLDGEDDLALSGNDLDSIELLLGSGAATFTSIGNFSTADTPVHVAVVDLNLDGVPDLAASNDNSESVSVLIGNGDGTFQPAVSYHAARDPGGLTTGDLNQDGLPDVAVATGWADSIHVLLNSGLVFAPPVLPNGAFGSWYSETVTVVQGQAPFVFNVSAGTLPPGLGLSANGVISGLAVQPGTFEFSVGAIDAVGCVGSHPYSITIGCAVSVFPLTLPSALQGSYYGQALTANGGTPPYTYAVTSGGLPAGLTLDAGGLLSGTPVSQGTWSFVVTATGAGSCQGSRSYTLAVGQPEMDIVVGQGLGKANPNRVRVFDITGSATPTDFYAYSAGQWGVNVTSGEIDADGYAEILTGPGPGDVYGPQVRGFKSDGTPMGKVNFYAYGTLRYGVNVGDAELDGDGFREILTGPGPGRVFGPHVRAWDFDSVGITPILNFFAYSTLAWGVNVADSDVDGDLFWEILTGAGPGPNFAATVRGWNFDGTVLTSIQRLNFNPYAFMYGVNVAGEDVDADSYGEMATVPGPGPTNPAWYKGFNFDGGSLSLLPGFNMNGGGLYGGRVGLGTVGSDASADLLTGAGRDPSAPSTVMAYDYNGATLTLLPNSFTPFGPGYGVNLAAGALGY